MKIVKTILIVIFALLLAASVGLLGYGISQGPQKSPDNEGKGMLGIPAEDLFFEENPQIDVKTIETDTQMSAAEKAATMLVKASYNMASINQFYGHARVDTEIPSADKHFFSDYYRGKNGVNMFYHSLVYTGTLVNPFQYRIDYVDQRMTKSGSCDYEDGKYKYAAEEPSGVSDIDLSLPSYTPYLIYSWFDFPLDLGGVKKAQGGTDPNRTDAVDYSLIDESTVRIEEAGENGEKYYIITFKVRVDKAQASSETVYRFADTNKIEKPEFGEITVEAEIWKDSGVFRQLNYQANAKISKSGKRGDGVITKTWKFSYNDTDCSVAKHIQGLGEKWVAALSEKNQAILRQEVAALEEKVKAAEASK